MSHHCSICCNTYKSVHYCNGCDNGICRACARHIVNDYGDTALGEYSVCVHCNRPLSIHMAPKTTRHHLHEREPAAVKTAEILPPAGEVVRRNTSPRGTRAPAESVEVTAPVRTGSNEEGQYPHDGELTRLHRALANLNTNNFQRGGRGSLEVFRGGVRRLSFEGR